jgi:tRNA A37 methylthiotransferase MiaB
MAFCSENVGQVLPVLVEKAVQIEENQWRLSGFSDNYLRVYITSSAPCQNQVLPVRVTKLGEGVLLGETLQS